MFRNLSRLIGCELAALMAGMALAGCVTIDKRREVDFYREQQTFRIEIFNPTDRMEFNAHYLGWVNTSDWYALTLPRGKSLVSVEDLILTQRIKGVIEARPLGPGSTVTVSEGDVCTFVLKLFDDRGMDYKINGTYRDGSCKR